MLPEKKQTLRDKLALMKKSSFEEKPLEEKSSKEAKVGIKKTSKKK